MVELAERPRPLPRNSRLTEERFLVGFVAALRAEGETFISTWEDTHHARFDIAMREMSKKRAAGDPGASTMPRTFMPTPVTGRYRELDDVLLGMQDGDLSAPNPHYSGIRLKMSRGRAESILRSFSDVEQDVLRAVARDFRDAQV